MKKQDYKYKPEGSEALSRRVIGVKLPIEIEQAVKSIPVSDRGKWLRRVVSEAAKKELIKSDESDA